MRGVAIGGMSMAAVVGLGALTLASMPGFAPYLLLRAPGEPTGLQPKRT